MIEVDIWFGIDSGCGQKVKGHLVDGVHDSKGHYKIEITDQEFLDTFAETSPFETWAKKLDANKWVSYDTYCWSKIGEVKEEDTVFELFETGKIDPLTNRKIREKKYFLYGYKEEKMSKTSAEIDAMTNLFNSLFSNRKL